MYTVFSITKLGNTSLSFTLWSCMSTADKFLSLWSLILLLASHTLQRFILFFISASICRPDASLLVLPIVVGRPMSWIANEPAALSTVMNFGFVSFSLVGELHCLSVSFNLSLTILPQLEQTVSLDSCSLIT